MPIYQYECADCGKGQEQYFTISSRPQTVPCECGGAARKVMMIGAVIGDDMPSWMRNKEFLGCLQNSSEKRITTRSEYNRYIKQRGIVEQSKYREI